ncbi:MAG: hypothetical protein OXB88_03825 [Bacteriovoracales bacterium]|nr:hypothetical protein [Bacteriovoracales bacterium]
MKKLTAFILLFTLNFYAHGTIGSLPQDHFTAFDSFGPEDLEEYLEPESDGGYERIFFLYEDEILELEGEIWQVVFRVETGTGGGH